MSGDRHQMAAYPLRLPSELKAWLQQRAAENRRSLNAEVIITLEKAQKQEKAVVQTT
jgi:hypothetical protein